MSTGLEFESIELVSARIRSGEVSPIGLTEAALDSAEGLGVRLNAVLRVFRESALQRADELAVEAKQGNIRGPLHGILIGLKDLVDVAGEVTTGGSTILKNSLATRDATVAEKLKAAGAILIGKLNLNEFALGVTGMNPHYGNARNPWDPDRMTGGSSGGSGASTAAGIVYGAIGTDTGGSVRIPAAMCGLAGLKPTYGLVSRAGVLDLSWSCDHVGPMARNVGDAAIMLNAIAGHDPRDPASASRPAADFTPKPERGLDGVRIGVPQHYFFDELDGEVEDAVGAAIALMEANGAIICKIGMPWVGLGRDINLGILMPEALSVHENWLKDRRSEYDPIVSDRLLQAVVISGADYLRAQRLRRWFSDKIAEVMRDIDVLVTPTLPEQTPRFDSPPRNIRAGSLTGVFNATGTPSLSLNCGFTRDGMPIGMMISGKPFAEATVLQIGHAYEQIAGWTTRRPAPFELDSA